MKKGSRKDARQEPKVGTPNRSLEEIEKERRDRQHDILKKKFETTLKHMSDVERVNEECNRARKGLSDAAKTSVRRDNNPPGRRTGRK